MGRDIIEVKNELKKLPVSIFITKWILEHTPYIFEDQEFEYIEWREKLADKLRIDTCDIIITGSASLGFSISPEKKL